MMILPACGSSRKNGSAGQIPVAMECPASQDSSQGCPSPSNPTIPLDGGVNTATTVTDNKSEAALRTKTRTQIIEGRCELWVKGDKAARSCDSIKVMVRSTEKGEMRDGVVDGFAITFPDLNEKSYKVLAQSDEMKIITPNLTVRPGKKVVLKLKATPIAR